SHHFAGGWSDSQKQGDESIDLDVLHVCSSLLQPSVLGSSRFAYLPFLTLGPSFEISRANREALFNYCHRSFLLSFLMFLVI
ncbi:hypothetical protein NAL12_08335, partial [Corynebacterium belfantii]|uniref:hypothetical protein n=1 Tax=Corynebacterium belfantii TaxID=2014537 RepID=UPI00397738AB